MEELLIEEKESVSKDSQMRDFEPHHYEELCITNSSINASFSKKTRSIKKPYDEAQYSEYLIDDE